MQTDPSKIWTAQKGSQRLFLSCPHYEVLYEGTRGGGKTDALLFDFVQHCSKGFGTAWRGILFRRQYKELADIITKSKKWFYQSIEGIKYNESSHTWTWPSGEQLIFSQCERESDYMKYHGHEYPWIGWEELTAWQNDKAYDAMKSCCRSSTPNIPKKYRSTSNPYGVGHGWVKIRFVDIGQPGTIAIENNQKRVRIKSSIYENKILLDAQPEYLDQLKNIKDPNKRAAWLNGSWDLNAGGALNEFWDSEIHIVKPFTIPVGWQISRSFDWGSSKPFSLGWWVVSDGTEATLNDGSNICYPRGTAFRIAEFYGWNGTPDEGLKWSEIKIIDKIKEIERKLNLPNKVSQSTSYADASIFNTDRGESIAEQHRKQGVVWQRSNKSPGSRKQGLALIRSRLENSKKGEGPGLYIFSNCLQSIRTVPSIPLSTSNPEDVDSDCEDHIYDEWRYFLYRPSSRFKPIKLKFG